MNPFERLVANFSECKEDIKHGETVSDWDISDVMSEAGKALFKQIKSKGIDLGNTPEWFTRKPKGFRTDNNGKDDTYYNWDCYWGSAIEWLSENEPNSVVPFPSYIWRSISIEDRLYGCHGITEFIGYFIHSHCHSKSYHSSMKRAWLKLARASKEACLYLADRLSSKSTPKKSKGTRGRPAVSANEAQKREDLKKKWERFRDAIKGTDKKKCFCDDNGITIDYLNNSVLRYCRDHGL